MTFFTLLRRNLRYCKRMHMGVAASAFFAAMVLTGTLITGDSLRHSQRETARLRLGETRFAVPSSPRFFRADLSDRLGASLDAETAAVLQTRGLCETGKPDAADTVNIRIYGVRDTFWSLAPTETSAPDWGERGIVINEPLATKLGLDVGGELVVRTQSARRLSSDITFFRPPSKLQSRRFTIVRILTDKQFGRFSLDQSQTASPAVFLPLDQLSADIDIPGRANLLLVAQNKDKTLDENTVRQHLRQVYTLEDAELELISLDNAIQLQSPRIFLDKTVETAAGKAGTNPSRFQTYFVHGITEDSTNALTPFVFVTATDDESLIRNVRDGEIVVTDWLADDLSAHAGALLQMSYLNPTKENGLSPSEITVILKRVIPQDTASLNRNLTPAFPGLTDAENCADWNPGVPLDLDRLRPKDEAYWDSYGPTPRALINLSFGRELWANRFGALTAVRYPAESNQISAVRESLRANLTPESLGVRIKTPFAEGQQAASNTTNFTPLFLGLNSFLLAAALVLIALLFSFTVEQRATEAGLLRALGFPAQRIRRLLRTEGMLLALAGIIPGTLAGAAYNVLILTGLATIWRDAAGAGWLTPWIRWQALAWGAGVSLLLSWLVLSFIIKRGTTSSPPLINLLHHEGAAPIRWSGRSPLPSYILAVLLAAGAASISPLIKFGNLSNSHTSLMFFLCGALILLAAFCIVHAQLIRLTRRLYGTSINLRRMGWRNTVRHPKRSMATIVMLGCGVFLVLAVGGNRRLAGTDTHLRRSGTGGFAFYGESALPMDMNQLDPENSADDKGLPRDLQQHLNIIPLLTQGTEQANKHTLNQVESPRLLGVEPAALADRQAFRFQKTIDLPPPQKERQGDANNDGGSPTPDSGWQLLTASLGKNVVPGIADSATIRGGLNKQLGDTISYTDELGNSFRVKLVGAIDNSILQGSILINRDVLRQRFTNSADTHAMLVDVPEESRARARADILRIYANRGLELTPAADRLQSFLAVQNTYRKIFLVLGGLGILIGTAGLAIMISRNAAERVREFAVLRAVGFSRRQVRALLIWEHLLLAAAGLLCALAGSAAGLLPPLIRGDSRILWTSAGITLALLATAAVIWILLAAAQNTRGELLDNLRHE